MNIFKAIIFLFCFIFFPIAAEEVLSEQVIATRDTFRKYIMFTLEKNDTPHYQLMTELLAKKPDIAQVKSIISKYTEKEIDYKKIDYGEFASPLMACAALGHNSIMALLLEKKDAQGSRIININQTNRRHQSALMLAAMANNKIGVIQLINAGARLDLKDRDQESTAQDYARSFNHQYCLKIIQDAEVTQRMRFD